MEFVSADETLLHDGLDDVSCSLPSDVGAAVTQCSQHLELDVVATAANLEEEGQNRGQDPSVGYPCGLLILIRAASLRYFAFLVRRGSKSCSVQQQSVARRGPRSQRTSCPGSTLLA